MNALSALVLVVALVYVQVAMGSLMSDSVRVQTGLAGLGWVGLNCWAWLHDQGAADTDTEAGGR